MGNKRLLWLDITKGIAIILVVLGHSGIPIWLNRFIFTFHVPIFFIAAGITNDFTKPWAYFLKRKIRTLLLPFLIYSAIILYMRQYVSDLTLGELTLNLLKNGWVGVPLWFVPVLFVSLVVLRLTFDIKNNAFRYAIWIILPLISIDLCHYHYYLPWNMSVVPFATSFILIGHLCNGILIDNIQSLWKGLLTLIITIVVSMVARLDMCFNTILPVTLIVIGALTGSYMVFVCSFWIERHLKLTTKVFQKIGKETYLILAFAEIIIVYLNYFFELNMFVKYGIMAISLLFLYEIKKLVIIIVQKI